MAKKSVALIGPGKGPDVRTGWSKKARIQVKGIKSEESVAVIQTINEAEDAVLLVVSDGIYDLIECAFTRVVYEGKNKNFTACVLIGG